jgi:ribosomal protein L29
MKKEILNAEKIRAMDVSRIVELQKQFRAEIVESLMDVYSEGGKNRLTKHVLKKNLARLATVKQEKEVVQK